MALSVSSFPDRVYITPSDPNDPSTADQSKGRKIFRNPFGKSSSPLFSRITPRRQNSTPITTFEKYSRRDPSIHAIPPRPPSPDVIDLTHPNPSRSKVLLTTTLSSPALSNSDSPASQDDVLIFPPTPTLPTIESPNPMKESIKALGRLSRYQRPVDWARKEDTALPPWASRNVIDSFGDPLLIGHPDRDRDRDRSAPQTPVSTSSSCPPSSTGATHGRRPSGASLATASSAGAIVDGRRPSTTSVGTTPDSRTSSIYWSSATSALSTSTSPQVPAKPGIPPRSRTTSDAASLAAPSEKSAKTSASSNAALPSQLTGANAMRLRAASTTSTSSEKEQAKKARMAKPSLTIIPPTAALMKQHQQRKRAQSLSSVASSETNKEKEPAVVPPLPPTTAGSTKSKGGRTRATSSASQGGVKHRSRSKTVDNSSPYGAKNPPVIPPLSSLPASLSKTSLSSVDMQLPNVPFATKASRSKSPARTAPRQHPSSALTLNIPQPPLPTGSSSSSGFSSSSAPRLPPLPQTIAPGARASSHHTSKSTTGVPPPPPLQPHELRRLGPTLIVPPPPPLPLKIHPRGRSQSTSTQRSPVAPKSTLLHSSTSSPAVPSLKSMAVAPPSLPPLASVQTSALRHPTRYAPSSYSHSPSSATASRPPRSLPLPPTSITPSDTGSTVGLAERVGLATSSVRILTVGSTGNTPISSASGSAKGIALGSPDELVSSSSIRSVGPR